MHAAPTTSIETVTIVRPLKVIAFLCLCAALMLLVICLLSTWWLRSGGFRTGLFQECMATEGDGQHNARNRILHAPAAGECRGTRNNLYVRVVMILMVIAFLICIVAAVLTLLGLVSSNYSRKYLWYKIATWLALLAVLLKLIALVVFPVCFYMDMSSYGRRSWEFDWSYGVAWGATLFSFGAALLLICDKEHEEIYYKEKTVYHSPSNNETMTMKSNV